MVFRIEIDPAAAADIEEIHDWFVDRSPEWAERWRRGLFKAIQTLKKLPRRCPRVPERESYGGEVRQLLYGKRSSVYRVVFSIEGDLVRILAVIHGARGPAGP